MTILASLRLTPEARFTFLMSTGPIITVRATSRDRAGRGARLLVVGDADMKCHWWVSGLAVLALAAGCNTDKTLEDMQAAAENKANQMAAEVEKAGEEAMAEVKEAGEEAKANVEGTGEDVKAAVEGAGEDAKSDLEKALGSLDLSALKIGDVEVGKEAGTLAETLTSTLGEIKDVESAQAALPKLEEVNLNLDELVGLVDQIPEAIRPALASTFKTHRAKLQESIEKVVTIEGVGEIIKPVLDQIAAKLDKVGGGEAAATPEPAPAP
jgi:hypothetical protein